MPSPANLIKETFAAADTGLLITIGVLLVCIIFGMILLKFRGYGATHEQIVSGTTSGGFFF